MQRLFSLTTSLLALTACGPSFELIGTDDGLGEDEATSEGEDEATTEESGSSEGEAATEESSSREDETTSGDEGTSEDETSEGGEHDALIAEAIADVDAIANATIGAFLLKNPGWYDDPENVPQHLCPHPWQSPEGGESGVTPPLAVNCNTGPGGLCEPTTGGAGPAVYDIEMWTQNHVWSGAGFLKWTPHAFHYNLITANTGEAECSFTVQAFADLDDDGVFSTYERSGELGGIEGVGLGVISLSELTIIDGDE